MFVIDNFISLVRPEIQETIYVKTPRVAEELDPSIPPVVKVKHTEQDVHIIRRSMELSHLHAKPNKVISIGLDCPHTPPPHQLVSSFQSG
jgi:hypothetical protein